MLADGKKIKEEIKQELKKEFAELGPCTLAVVWVGDDPVVGKFVEQKRKFAEAIGIELRLFEYDASISEADLEREVTRLANDQEIKGIIVQLPLPAQIDSKKIVELIPAAKDVDALTSEARVFSPVAGAVKEILERYQVDLNGKNIVVLGKGKLVGRPVSIWLAQEGFDVDVLDRDSSNIDTRTKAADVIICGVGQAGFLTRELVKSGAVIIDAGTTEQGGQLAGDASPECAEKASLFTPVPGGVGPVMLAMLFKNQLKLCQDAD